MFSFKSRVAVLALITLLLAAPLAAAERIRGVDGRWYQVDEKSAQAHSDRRGSYGYGSPYMGGAVTTQRYRHVQHRHRHFHAYRNWYDYCRNNWRRDPRC